MRQDFVVDPDYLMMINNIDYYLKMNGFVKLKNQKSKWFNCEDNIIEGNIEQWIKDNSYISIDIANFVDDTDSQKIIEKVSKDSNTQMFLSNKTNFNQKYVDE